MTGEARVMTSGGVVGSREGVPAPGEVPTGHMSAAPEVATSDLSATAPKSMLGISQNGRTRDCYPEQYDRGGS